MRDKDLTLQTDEGGTFRSPSSVFCSVSEHLPPSQAAAISSRVGNSSAQTVGAQAFRTLDFRLFEHKIAIFVRFLPSEPSFSGISSTKSGFLCSEDWESGIGNPKIDIGNTESGLPANHRAHL